MPDRGKIADWPLEERRAYHRQKTAEHRARNRERVNEAARDRLRARGAFLRDYKAERGCKDCGEKDPVVLELDHIDPATKDRYMNKYGRTAVAWRSMGLEKLKAELEKCEVVCANCHRRRTSVQLDWTNYN
jgi:5-methylcytosine-specific restriction endonuclease McrA